MLARHARRPPANTRGPPPELDGRRKWNADAGGTPSARRRDHPRCSPAALRGLAGGPRTCRPTGRAIQHGRDAPADRPHRRRRASNCFPVGIGRSLRPSRNPSVTRRSAVHRVRRRRLRPRIGADRRPSWPVQRRRARRRHRLSPDRSLIRVPEPTPEKQPLPPGSDRKSTCLNSSHVRISYAVFCLKKKKKKYNKNPLKKKKNKSNTATKK